jgi:hypothetical protein
MFPFGGQNTVLKNGLHRALDFTSAAPDALGRVDVQLWGILVAMDTVNGTNFDAGLVFHADTWLCYYIIHNWDLCSKR